MSALANSKRDANNEDGVELINLMSRTFTLDEAQDLLPVLESLLRTSIDAKKLIES